MDITKWLVFIFVGLALIVAVAGNISTNTVRNTEVVTSSFNVAVPINITLTGDDPYELTSVTNGSDTIPATNYTTSFTGEGGYFQLDDNTSFSGTLTLTYSDTQDDYVENTASRVILALTTLFVTVGFIYVVAKGKSK